MSVYKSDSHLCERNNVWNNVSKKTLADVWLKEIHIPQLNFNFLIAGIKNGNC